MIAEVDFMDVLAKVVLATRESFGRSAFCIAHSVGMLRVGVPPWDSL